MPASYARASRIGFGCLTLFALPFAAVGIGATYWAFRTAADHTRMQTWVEMPAVIKQAELKRNGGEDDTFQAIAVYEYEFGGRKYVGERVGIFEASDNVGSFHRDAYRELKRHLDEGRAFRCFVNPKRPSEAILYRQLRWEMLSFNTIFAVAFGSVGLGLMTGALAARRRLQLAADAEDVEDKPWMVRADWASGRILPTGGAEIAVPVLRVVALYWFIASLPLLWKLPTVLGEADTPWVWSTLAFPAVGAVLIFALAHQWLRRQKFGESVLELASTPGVVGGQLAGVVRIAKMVRPESGFRVKLSCVERIRHGDDTRENVLWQDERLVMEPMRDRGGEGAAVPVLFVIPFESQESSRPKSTRDVHWQLELSAPMPGVDYKSRFDVPIFKTADSRPDFKLDESLAADFAMTPPRELVFSEAGIIKEPMPRDGVRLVFPAARNLGSAVFVTVFLAIWSGAIWLMLHLGAPIIFPIVFGFFELFLVWAAVELWFYRSFVEADRNGLRSRGGLFGIGPLGQFAPDEIKEFRGEEQMSSGSQVWKNLVVVPRKGKRRKLAKGISSKLALDAAIDELKTAIGHNLP
ncbi:MAG TPA: DUF3592 domain-containing protein, partial [Lacipirellulaceae bacterium]|nr:DUF3592 domain-containing protein [Lacipirellulaceae bacterium]